MRVISLSNASSLPHAGTEYLPDEDGVYNLPEPVGVELTTKHASMWVAESTHLAAASAAEVDRLRDPTVLHRTVAALLGRVAALEKRLEAPKAEPVTGPPVKAATDEPKPGAARTPTTAKKTPAKKTAPAKKAASAAHHKGAEDHGDGEDGKDGEQSEAEAPAKPGAARIKERDDPAWP
jgi:hypothetical protein